MKMTKLSLGVLLCLVFLFSGCVRKNSIFGCPEATAKYLEEFTAYTQNQSTANCERLLKSIKDIYNSCASLSNISRQEYEELEKDLNCSN